MKKKKYCIPLQFLIITWVSLFIFWTGVIPSSALAAQSCSSLFKLDLPILKLRAKLSKISGRVAYEYLEASDHIAIRQQYTRVIETALGKSSTMSQIIDIYREIIDRVDRDELLEQAILGVDFLLPLRGNLTNFKDSDLAQLRNVLDHKAGEPQNPVPIWSPLRDSFLILENPIGALTVVEKFIRRKDNLITDYQFNGAYITRPLLLELQNLPTGVRSVVFANLKIALQDFDAHYSRQNFIGHISQIREKEPRRSLQFLQQVVMHGEFSKMIEALTALRGTSGKEEQFYKILEGYAKLFAPGQPQYSYATVMQVAKSLQESLKQSFEPGASMEIFGSFPNLLAKIGSSDIDMVLSDKMDTLYQREIKGGFLGDNNFANSKHSPWSDAAQLANALLGAENRAMLVLGVQQKPGELLSISTRPISMSHGAAYLEATTLELMSRLTMVSPIVIYVTARRITLRIYDSVNAIPGEPPVIHRFAF